MDALTQYLDDCRVGRSQDSARKTKLAAVVGAMTREELLDTYSAATFAPITKEAEAIPEEFDDEFLTKIAFVASVGANERITLEMVKEAGPFSAALKPYLGRGYRALKALVTGSMDGRKVARGASVKNIARNVKDSYLKGSAGGKNRLDSVYRGVKRSVIDNPAAGVAAGGAVAGVAGVGGLRKLLKKKQPQPVYAKYAAALKRNV